MANETNCLDFTEYNWDEISIGNHDTNNSRFFGRRHPEHERNPQDFPEDDVENNFNMNNFLKDLAEEESETVDEKSPVNTNCSDGQVGIQSTNEANIAKPSNLGKPKPPPVGKTKDFNVVKYGAVYEKKQKQRVALEDKRLKEQRMFTSKPAPNFNAIHAAQEQKRNQEPIRFTVPSTPKVLHRHREGVERMRKKQEEILAAQAPKAFKSNADPDVLKTKPFVPKPATKPTTEPAPFNLHSDERSRERRLFDEEKRLETERKEKEEEEMRLRQEEQIRREIRKATTFKARRNPFSNQ